ncbi:MAG: hypothetical protein SAK29_28505 [Scytonema sp. PMC 1069.18]|nr:hypothetical protein [Scytonema sp. PMC 1069.18]MEC4888084.1 hypothetical protein [Scytonema sp. PMC 1070.18]
MNVTKITEDIELVRNHVDLLQQQIGKLSLHEHQYKQISRTFATLHASLEKLRALDAIMIEELQKQQQLFEQIAESIPAILYVYDMCEQRNIYANRKLINILGYSPETVQAMNGTYTILNSSRRFSHSS